MKLSEPIDELENNDEALMKYKSAGQIATKVVSEIVKQSKSNIKLIDLWNIGVTFASNELSKVYNKVSYKGFCFPLCLSINNIAGNNIVSDSTELKNGDILKINLGLHIDGYPAMICYSTIIGTTNNTKTQNVMKACIEASKEVSKLMTPGRSNMEVSKLLNSIATKYDCNLPLYNEIGNAPGIYSRQVSRYVIDGQDEDNAEFIHQFILPRDNPNYEFDLVEAFFEENEVYAIDIMMCSGSGKLQQSDVCNIYKRNYENKVLLKLKSSREALQLFGKDRFPLQVNTDITSIRLGLKECIEKKLVEKYPVCMEKEGEVIGRICFTIIVKKEPVLLSGKSSDAELKKFVK